jgi:hypothetical protein
VNAKRALLIAIPLLLLLVAGVFILARAGTVKEPAVAGQFYPADKGVLASAVGSFLATAKTTTQAGDLIALIAPHAGYQFSGRISAYSYNQLAGKKIETVILIGPAHYASFTGAAVLTSGKMRTPLGDIRINSSLARALINEKAQVASSPSAFEKEHSLEVQLPFLQTVLKDFTLVPILISVPTGESFQFLTQKLTEIVTKNPNTILIASSDLSHYHDYATAVKMDRAVIDAASRMSLENLEKILSSGEGEMCGHYPVLFTMAVARNLGATHGVLYKYANSGDVTGDRSRVVGYAAMGLYKTPLTAAERTELLALAKKTIESYVRNGKTPDYAPRDSRFLANGAAFVTINRNGSLRGCIGTILPVMPLYQAVQRNAVSACSLDRRFSPVEKDELKDLDVEVTVLSPLEQLDDIKKIRIGTHGLYLVKGQDAGILLPQVAEEYKWDVPTFLQQVSIKAGLREDGWKDAQLYTFTADIIR